MFGKWGVLFLATLAAGVVLTSSAGASPQGTSRGIDLSSRAGIAQYLTSLGVNAHGIVVQRGAHNYAGPSCPGRGWTCTTATRVLQIAPKGLDSGGHGDNGDNGDHGNNGDNGHNGDNQFECTASTGSGGSSSPPDGCTIVQVSTGGDNSARCVERSGDASVSQSCAIFQTNTTGDNHLQVRQQVDAKGGATQAATQYAGVNQVNGSGSNEARIFQDLEQSTKDTDATGTQIQTGHQAVSVNQQSDTGGNTANVNQSLALSAKATGATVSQNQNTDGSGLNTSAGITQGSTSGQNRAYLNQLDDLDGTVSRTSNGSQTQGSLSGGLGGFFSQNSTGLSTVKLNQREHQDLKVDGGDNRENGRNDHGKKKPPPPPPPGVVTQTQYGPMWTDPGQGSNPADRYDINQSSSQHASNPTFQDDRAYGQCDTSGNCTIDQRIQQQGQSNTNSCSGQSCNIGLTVTLSDGETSTSKCEGADSDFSCPRAPDPPPPPFPPNSGCGTDCLAIRAP